MRWLLAFRNSVLTGAFLLVAATTLKAQDTLITVHGDILAVRLLEISNSKIIFQPNPADTTSTSAISSREVFIIKFRNGMKQVYSENLEPLPENQTQPAYTSTQLALLGEADAQRFVNPGNRSIAIGALTLASPLAGLIVALSTTSIAPPTSLTTSNSNLLSEQHYINSYISEGQRIKRRKGMQGFIFGCGLYVLIIGMVVSESN